MYVNLKLLRNSKINTSTQALKNKRKKLMKNESEFEGKNSRNINFAMKLQLRLIKLTGRH